MTATRIVATLATLAAFSAAGLARAEPAAQQQDTLSPITATFIAAEMKTEYTAVVTSPAQPAAGTVSWSQSPPPGDPNCRRFDVDRVVRPGPNTGQWIVRATWHHADADACSHTGTQHNGTVTVQFRQSGLTCTASYGGTVSGTGPPAICTRKSCLPELARVAAAEARLKALKLERERLERDFQWARAGADAAERALRRAAAGLDAAGKKLDPPPDVKAIRAEGLEALRDMFAIEDRIERIDERIEDAEAELAAAKAALARCEASYRIPAAGEQDVPCAAERVAAAAAAARSKALADVRAIVPARVLNDVLRGYGRSAAAFVALAARFAQSPRTAASAPLARSIAARFDLAVKRLGRLLASSVQLDRKLAAARSAAKRAASTHAACEARTP